MMPTVTVQGVSAQVLMGRTWNAVSYQCPYCHAVLGVEIDPMALKLDVVSAVIGQLRR
jgi:hypothetical protein